MAERKTRAGPHHESAQTGDDAIGRPKVGCPLAIPIQNENLLSHQDGLGDDGPETTGLSKPDDGDDRMEKKSENVAHARDGIKRKNLKNSGRLRNSPRSGSTPQW